MNMLILLVGALLSAVLMLVLGIWTYRDAKRRGLDAGLWTAIVLLVPNLIGLLLYFLIGRRQAMVLCPHCGGKVPKASRYCMDCGKEIDPNDLSADADPRRSRRLLIVVVSCFVCILLLFGAFLANVLIRDDLNLGMGVSVGMAQSNIGRKWSISYLRSNEKFTKTIKKENGSPAALSVEAQCSEGSLWLTASQGDIAQSWDITKTFGEISLDLSRFSDGKIILRLEGDEAKNVRFKAHW